MFLLSSARDNAVFGRYRGSKAVPLSRTYPRRLVGKIPMPTFDPGKSFCCACGEPVDRGSETDVCRMERIPPLTGWITPIAGTFVHIVHKRLWDMFPKNRTNGFVVGKAFDANGVPMDDWVSLSGRNAIVRNATPAYYGICAGCGSFSMTESGRRMSVFRTTASTCSRRRPDFCFLPRSRTVSISAS